MKSKYMLLFAAVFTVAGCSLQSTQQTASSPKQQLAKYSAAQILEAHDWRLTSIKGEQVKIAENATEQKVVGIKFDAQNKRASGFSGCNQFSGGYLLSENKLTFQQMLSTQMACQQSDIEMHYLQALASVQHYKINGNKLMLLDVNKSTVASFVIDNKL